MKLPLSNRLLTCCQLVHPGDRVADIGCDHGKLTAVLAALLLSAGVELAQWRWQLGQAETDDCLANVLGGLLGSGIFALRCRASARLLRRGEDASGHT